MGAATRFLSGSSAGRVARRALLAAVGLALIAYLVHGAGAERVARVLWQARPWLPLIVALELAQLLSDAATLRLLLGPTVARGAWVRSSALAYVLMILVPAGRAAGEVARAAVLSREVGPSRAARASIELQSAYVFAIGVLSAAECVVVGWWLGPGTPLMLLLALNATVMVAFSAGLLAILRHARVGRLLERLLRRLSHTGDEAFVLPAGARPALPWRSACICVASRSAQVVQYGVILHAVGGTASVVRALAAHGIHLVAATVGDIVPNGLGIVDGTYRTFAADVGFADAPARALSIAFVAHLAQLIVASGALLCLAIAGMRGAPVARAAQPVRAEAQSRS
jgi:hypothetical protein